MRRNLMQLPCVSFINNLDTEKAYDYISNGFAGKVLAIYQRNYYSWHPKDWNLVQHFQT